MGNNPQNPTLQFLGAAGTVTGSKYLIRFKETQILLDAGLFQGLKELRLRNWAPVPFDPSSLDAVVLSHAHIDHSGYLPVLAREGFRGKILCTSGTKDLLDILLLDAAHLQEEEAEAANRHGYTKHHPALPLYTIEDAQKALGLVRSFAYDQIVPVTADITAKFRPAGHILGSATVELNIGPTRLVFSGDLGRWDQLILRDPAYVPEADTLIVESTYGNRLHAGDVMEQVKRVIHEAVARGGALIIPAFAVGRVQQLIWIIHKLEEQGAIPSLPVYVDTPMGTKVDEVYCHHLEDFNDRMKNEIAREGCVFSSKQYYLSRTKENSKQLNDLKGPVIIISSSGMATGGRVLHHLEQRLPDPRTTVLLVGYQAAGTRGRALKEGAASVRIHGKDIPVKAKIEEISGLSAHGDQEDILRWLSGFKRPPRQTYIVHGEPDSAQNLASSINAKLGWKTFVAVDKQCIDLMFG